MKIPDPFKSILKKSGVSKYFYTLYDGIENGYRNFLLKNSPLHFTQYRYKSIYGKKANLKNPVTLDEKLVWLMLYWRHPLKTECADKYAMRSYVQKHGWEQVLPELLGVYQNSSEIDFDTLPSKFVLKCTHGCGFNIFCEDKQTLDRDAVRRKLDRWISMDYSKFEGELHYASMKPRIICEPFLEDLVSDLPVDYKLYCFNGKAHCTLVVKGRDFDGHNVTSDFYDLEWKNKLPYFTPSLFSDRHTPRPDAYESMIEAAEELSKPFPFVRMDFYNIRGKAVLGEMTFTPGGGIVKGYTETAQNILGSLIKLPPRVV